MENWSRNSLSDYSNSANSLFKMLNLNMNMNLIPIIYHLRHKWNPIFKIYCLKYNIICYPYFSNPENAILSTFIYLFNPLNIWIVGISWLYYYFIYFGGEMICICEHICHPWAWVFPSFSVYIKSLMKRFIIPYYWIMDYIRDHIYFYLIIQFPKFMRLTNFVKNEWIIKWLANWFLSTI